jgi:hypothetical protein
VESATPAVFTVTTEDRHLMEIMGYEHGIVQNLFSLSRVLPHRFWSVTKQGELRVYEAWLVSRVDNDNHFASFFAKK